MPCKIPILDFTQTTFMDIVQDLATGAKYYYRILDAGKVMEYYLNHGKDPVDALDFILSVYQAVPECQEEIRGVLLEALGEYNG